MLYILLFEDNYARILQTPIIMEMINAVTSNESYKKMGPSVTKMHACTVKSLI